MEVLLRELYVHFWFYQVARLSSRRQSRRQVASYKPRVASVLGMRI